MAAGMVLLYRVLQALQVRLISCWLILALIGLDAKIVDFSINGMETGLLMLFLPLAIHGMIVTGPRQMVRLGVGWGGLMWTRPDSFVYIAILGMCALIFPGVGTTGKSRVEWGKMFLGAGLVGAVLYLSWFVWAWWYYGSPVPHTIIAKAADQPPLSLGDLVDDLVTFPFKLVTPSATSMQFTFLPSYWEFGGWPAALAVGSYALGLPAAFAWLITGVRPQTRLFSLAYFFGNFFLTAIVRKHFPWYLPAVAVFGYLSIGLLFDQVLELASRPSPPGWACGWSSSVPKVLRVGAIGLVLGQTAVTVCVARQMQAQQQIIENGLRRPIGLWLREHAQTPHDTVLLESLGYIGYYSQLKMLDWPGLASEEVVQTRKRLGRAGENRIALELMPDWLVLRPYEIRYEKFIGQLDLEQCYDLIQVFDASDRINAARWLPGRAYLQWDQTFLVIHRKAGAPAKPPGGS
jgi:hypothetical protein